MGPGADAAAALRQQHRNAGTPNLAYFHALRQRPTFCVDGLVKPWERDAQGTPVDAGTTRKAA